MAYKYYQSYSWQRAVTVLEKILSARGSSYPDWFEVPYEQGVISVSRGQDFVVVVALHDVFSKKDVIVFKGSGFGWGKTNIEILHFNDGDWINDLERAERLLATDIADNRVSFAPIDDDYLFPEYAQYKINLDAFPMEWGGWREGWGNIERDIRSLSQYNDNKVRLGASPTRNRGILSMAVSISPPMQLFTWRLVFELNLRGGRLLVDVFRPGKWILYIHDRVSK